MLTFIEEPKFSPTFNITGKTNKNIEITQPIYSVAGALYIKCAKKLFLFRPYYDAFIDLSANKLDLAPVVHSDTNIIKYYCCYNKATTQSCLVLEYDIIGECYNSIDISINNTMYKLNAIDTIIPNDIRIAQSTLFKNDYLNTRLHVEYYIKYHGITTFFLYYNGDINQGLKQKLMHLSAFEDCKIYIFSIPYYYKLFNQSNSLHTAQSVQLTHSAILANYCCDWLLNVDLDEYVKPEYPLSEIISSNIYDYINIKMNEFVCGGSLCKRNYDYKITDIIPNIIAKDKFIVIFKYAERTRGLRRFLRIIHTSVYKKDCVQIFELDAYHIRCLSPFTGCTKRYCVPK